MPEVRAERGQRRLQALLVADVREHVVEAGHPALGADRRGNAALDHQRPERERLEQHRLAAGVRTRHEQRAFARRHLEIERHHADTLRQQQRMPPVAHMEAVARGREFRVGATGLEGIAGAAVERIERGERVERVGKRLALGAQFIREFAEEAFALLALLHLQFTDPVARFDRCRWLDEDRLPRLRRIVHDAAERYPSFAAHRNHIATVAQRHGRIVHAMVRLEPGHQAFEQPHEFALGPAHLLAQASQCGRGIVAQFPVLGEHPLEPGFDGGARDQPVGERGERRPRGHGPLVVAQRALRPS